MLKSYLISAIRSIAKSRLFTTINLVGLSVAMSCFIMVSLYVHYELTYDQFHDDVADIYLVKLKYAEDYGGGYNQFLPAVFADLIKEGTPGLEEVTTTLSGAGNMNTVKNEELIQERYCTLQNSFFDVFTFPFLYGDPDNALSEPTSVVISKTMALKYFQKENAVGEILIVDGKGRFNVTGVLADFPKNSQFQPHFSFPINGLSGLDSWDYNTFFVYLKTKPEVNLADIEARIASLYKSNAPKDAMYDGSSSELASFGDSYWQVSESGAALNNRKRGLGASKDMIYLCSALAVFLLIIALANYVNMATSKAIERSKEVGVRKVNGASRRQLIIQFIGETLIFSFLSLILSIIIVEIMLAPVSNVIGIELKLDFLDTNILLFLVAYALVCGVLGGIYPALLLSRFSPVKALRGRAENRTSSFTLRKILLFLQFSISAFMIVVFLAINGQIRHYLNFDLGFDKDNVVSVRLTDEMRENPEILRNRLLRIKGVEEITMGPMPGAAYGFNPMVYKEKEIRYVPRVETNESFLTMLKIPLISGRNFDPLLSSDQDNSVIINESLAKELDLENPVGETVLFADKQRTIIGFVKDFYISGPQARYRPLAITPQISGRVNNFLIKLNEEQSQSSLSEIAKVWTEFDAIDLFKYQFLDDAYEQKLVKLKSIASIINGTTLAIVIISLFGLFSLVSFQTSRRLKEIGIRKVLGASVTQILSILGKSYLAVISISSVVAIPLAYMYLPEFLMKYHNRIELEIDFAVLAILIIVLFSIVVITSRALMAVCINPVEILKDE